MKKGKGVGEGQGRKGNEGGRTREKPWEETARPERALENSDFGAPDVGTLEWPFSIQ